MRWIAVILFCMVLTTTWAEPDPKKYKPDVKDKTKPITSLTEEERKFLREVEAKFGIKSEVPLEDKVTEENETSNATSPIKAPFPAVIAIEIVNDTDSNSKGKRTIDANLGYGYRTNNGYTYTYFGKQPQEKGKFMIYPYSQEDIPPAPINYNSYKSHKTSAQSVEIQPSQAYELIDMNEQKNAYLHGTQPSIGTNYENIKGLVSPPRIPQTANPTFYATYNGQEFSALSSQFPTVMSNYLVDSSQLLKNPQYQSAGLSQDYLRHHGSQTDNKRVVPVLVLRVPSSYLKKPTAELYSNAPHNYPVSHYLNNINLQDLVNNYFKKIGYSFAPQLMTYQTSLLSEPVSSTTATPVASDPNYEPQTYASPYVNPSYSQADYSGVQYSSVQPVMAKYPSSYTRQQYYLPMTQTVYQQPEQQYEYTYQYTPQSSGHTQNYYVQPQYQTQEAQSGEGKGQVATVDVASAHAGHAEYGVPQQTVSEGSGHPAAEYGTPETHNAAVHSEVDHTQYVSTPEVTQEYGQPKEQVVYVPKSSVSTEYGPAKLSYSDYTQLQLNEHYSQPSQDIPKDSLAYFETYMSQGVPKYIMGAVKSGMQNYYYQKQMNEKSAGNSLVLSENYPSKDHTLATVLPVSYTHAREKSPSSVQAVSYVTPAPHKYQSHYRVMVPQTVFKNPSTEKVSYVNSHSLPYSQLTNQEYNPEAEYTLPAHYSPAVSKQKSSYPRNYHSHKRNVKPEKKSDSAPTAQKKTSESSESKKQSSA